MGEEYTPNSEKKFTRIDFIQELGFLSNFVDCQDQIKLYDPSSKIRYNKD